MPSSASVTKPLAERPGADFAGGGAAGDQFVDLRMSMLQQFHDRDAAAIALVVAVLAARGAVEHRSRTVSRLADQLHLVGFGMVGLLAVVAQPAHQALGDDADDVAGHDVGQDADVEQARDGADGRVGVQRRIDLVAGHRGAEGHFGGFGVADFADQDDVRILAHHRADAVGEIELGGLVRPRSGGSAPSGIRPDPRGS